MQSRRDREKEGRRSLIIDTAEKLFSEKGYALTTMDDIAQLSEFTKKSVYSYFPTKDELFAAAVVRASSTLVKLFTDAVDSGENGFAKVCAIGNAYVRFYTGFPRHFKILSLRHSGGADKSGPYRDEIEQHGAEIMRLMVQSFLLGQKDGSIRRDIDPRMASLHVMSVSNGILALVTESKDEFKTRFALSTQDFIRDSMKLIGDSIKVQKK
ncbi:MAG: TetR/AcrR family transcriptional regulator [Spirochaetota bacterium]